MKTPIKKAVGKKEKKDVYTITVTTEHGIYKGEGETALDALKALPTPELITSSTLVITHGDATKDMLFSGIQLKRLLNPYNQEVLIHDLEFGI